MIQITNYRQGAILNHNHGKETATGLTVKVQGISEGGYPVKVNGNPAEMDGRLFSADVTLTQEFNPVTATVVTPDGNYSQELTLVWDKKSFKRFNFYIDDHSFLFTDLTAQRPKHAFDHFYLDALKKIHDKWGLKVTLNTFYRNDHHPFELKDMPDIWKGEFIDNSDWLKFSFHSYSEFPDRPYAESSAEEIGRDWDLVQAEITRFAGAESYIPPVVIHWANIHPAAAQECIRRGMKCYSRAFRLRVMGGPSLADRQKGGNMAQIEQASCAGTDVKSNLDGLNLHYGFQGETDYLKKNFAYYDPNIGIFFCSGIVCCNLVPLKEIPVRYETHFKLNEAKGIELSGGASHEQYSFPYYENYLPDHLQRLETATRCMAEAGYKPVFFSEGLLGNNAW